MEATISAFSLSHAPCRLSVILSVKCFGFQGEVTRYSVVVQGGYCHRPFGKFFLAPMASFFFLCLLAMRPEREEVELRSVPLVPGLLSSLVWWAVETVGESPSW